MRKNNPKVLAFSYDEGRGHHSPFLVTDGKHRKEFSLDDTNKLLPECLISFFGQLGVVASSGTIGSNDEPRRSQAQRDDRPNDHDRNESYSS
jgi:hypothetical protein